MSAARRKMERFVRQHRFSKYQRRWAKRQNARKSDNHWRHERPAHLTNRTFTEALHGSTSEAEGSEIKRGVLSG